ncbi:MAG: hypothetical protein GX639_22135 [Fibrobacter sp.]|nr:hypothetical protein [Fibrobacter sp.]
MMILRKTILAITYVLILTSILLCTNQNSGVETTNGAVVYVHAEGVDGVVPPHAIVSLFDRKYIPFIDSGLGIVTVADINGKFSFKGMNIDTVSLTMFSSDLTNAAYLDAGAAGGRFDTQLDGKGILNGTVTASENDMVLVYIPGTSFYSIQKGSGPFVINSLPEGTYKVTAAIVQKTADTGRYVIHKESASQSVTVVSGKTVSLFFTVAGD